MTTHRADMTPEMIEADIALQREALAHTVTDLQAKLKVRARAAAAVAGAVVVAGLVALKVRHRRRAVQ